MRHFLFKKNSLVLGSLFPEEAATYRSVVGSLCLGAMDETTDQLLGVCFLTPSYESAYTMCIRTLMLAGEEQLSDADAIAFIEYAIEQTAFLQVGTITCELQNAADGDRTDRLLQQMGFTPVEKEGYHFTLPLDELVGSDLIRGLAKNEEKLQKTGFLYDKKDHELKEFSLKCLKNGYLFNPQNYDPDLTAFAWNAKGEIVGFARLIPASNGNVYIRDFYTDDPKKNPLAALSLLYGCIRTLDTYREDSPMVDVRMDPIYIPEALGNMLPKSTNAKKGSGLCYRRD